MSEDIFLEEQIDRAEPLLESSQMNLSVVPPTLGDPCETMPPNPSVAWLNTVQHEQTEKLPIGQGGRARWN